MVNDETDSCISERFQNAHPGKVNYWVNPLSSGQHAVDLGPCEQVLSKIKQCNLSQVNLGNV